MSDTSFRTLRPGLPEPGLLALNNAHAQELSLLSGARFDQLVGWASIALAAGTDDALLLGFDETSAYDGGNFLWFRQRYPHFTYIDRIVVAAHARGRGLARSLYQHAFTQAAAAGHGLVTCEINLDPPNPGSDAFHAALGFLPVGIGANGDKTVRYFARPPG